MRGRCETGARQQLSPLASLPIFIIHRLARVGLAKKREGSRKQIKEKKNRDKKVFGVGRRIAKHKAKKAAG